MVRRNHRDKAHVIIYLTRRAGSHLGETMGGWSERKVWQVWAILSHLVFERRQNTKYMYDQDVHMTYILKNITNNAIFCIVKYIYINLITSVTKLFLIFSSELYTPHRQLIRGAPPSTPGTSQVTHRLTTIWYPSRIYWFIASMSAPYSTNITSKGLTRLSCGKSLSIISPIPSPL